MTVCTNKDDSLSVADNQAIATEQDCWLQVLSWLCQHYQILRHPDQLLMGQALEAGKLTAEQFSLAAQAAGFDCYQTTLSDLEAGSVPAVLVGLNQIPAVITSIDDHQLTLVNPGDNSEYSCGIADLLDQPVWLLAPKKITDSRADNLAFEKPEHWLWQAIRSVKPWYRDLLLASFVVNVLALVVPLFTMNVYDRVVPNQAFNTLWVLSLGVFIAISFDWLLRKARSRLTDKAGREIDVKISGQIFAKVLGMSLIHRPASAGAFAKQIQEFDSVREFLTSATLTTIIDLPFTLLFLLIIAWLGGPMVLVPIAALGILLFLSWVLQKKLKTTIEESSRLSTQRQAMLIEQLQLLDDTKQLNAEGVAQNQWQQTISALSDWQNAGRDISNTLSYSVMNVQHLVTVGLIAMGVFRISEGLLSMGGLIAIVMLSGRAASAINQLSILLMRYQQTRAAIEGLDVVMQLPQERSPNQAMADKEFSGTVELRSASFRYPDQPSDVLADINVIISGGERVGVIGAAGAGKTTLLNVFSGQYQASGGQVYFDGVESHQWPLRSLRKVTGWVGQLPQLRFGSILENIIQGLDKVDKSNLARSLQASGFQLFSDRLDNGLETQVGELGRNLSGGQRQSVCLARALIREPKLLILDEPTSAMDQQLEQAVIDGLGNLPKDTGFIIASHKPQLLQLCQRIIVLDRGRIIADGDTQEILAQQVAGGRGNNRVRSVKVTRHNQLVSTGGGDQ